MSFQSFLYLSSLRHCNHHSQEELFVKRLRSWTKPKIPEFTLRHVHNYHKVVNFSKFQFQCCCPCGEIWGRGNLGKQTIATKCKHVKALFIPIVHTPVFFLSFLTRSLADPSALSPIALTLHSKVTRP